MTPAILDGQVHGRDDETDGGQSLQQAVVAANAAEDASRRTWTRAGQLMNEVYRNRGYYNMVHSQLKPNAKSRASAKGIVVARAQARAVAKAKARPRDRARQPLQNGELVQEMTRVALALGLSVCSTEGHTIQPSAQSTTNNL